MNLQTVYDNPLLLRLNHHLNRMNGERCGTFDEATLDAVLEIREILLTLLAGSTPKAEAQVSEPYPPNCSQPCMALTTTTTSGRWRTTCSKCNYDSFPAAIAQPASAEKPQAVADKEWAIGHGKTADEARAKLAEHRVLLLRKDLECRIAEARAAGREEALREVRIRLFNLWSSNPTTQLGAIDEMLARPTAEEKP